MKQLTKTQAIAEGYTLYGEDDQSFQSLMNLKDLSDEDFAELQDAGIVLVLANKEPETFKIDVNDVRCFVIDSYKDSDGFHIDDTNEIDRIVDKMKPLLEEMTQRINREIYGERPLYMLTNIQLVPDEPTQTTIR